MYHSLIDILSNELALYIQQPHYVIQFSSVLKVDEEKEDHYINSTDHIIVY